MIGQRKLLGDLPHREPCPIVVTHRKSARVRESRELVESSPVDLLLVLIEAMDEIARGHAERPVHPIWVVDPKRPIRETPRIRRIGPRRLPAPHRRQYLEYTSVAIALDVGVGSRVGDAIRARKQTE